MESLHRDRIMQLLVAAFVAALFYVGAGIHRQADRAGSAPIAPSAQAGLVVAPRMTVYDQESLITTGNDGKKLYMWSFGNFKIDQERLPVFQCTVSAE